MKNQSSEPTFSPAKKAAMVVLALFILLLVVVFCAALSQP
jgi:hypothetical protein